MSDLLPIPSEILREGSPNTPPAVRILPLVNGVCQWVFQNTHSTDPDLYALYLRRAALLKGYTLAPVNLAVPYTNGSGKSRLVSPVLVVRLDDITVQVFVLKGPADLEERERFSNCTSPYISPNLSVIAVWLNEDGVNWFLRQNATLFYQRLAKT